MRFFCSSHNQSSTQLTHFLLFSVICSAIARSCDNKNKKMSSSSILPASDNNIDSNDNEDADANDSSSSSESQHGDLATRARILFQECCRGGPQQNNNNGHTIHMSNKNNNSVRPTKGLYLALLDAYAVSGDPEAALEAEKVLEHLEERGDANQIAYNAVLNALKNSRPPNHLYRAEMILQRMEERKIADKISYTTLIGALAAKGDRASAQRAFAILEKMELAATATAAENASSSTTSAPTAFDFSDHSKTISTSGPNTQTYNAVLHALCQSGEMTKAETLLQRMEEGKCQQGTSPNVFSYATV
jgi:pentatricopeptide repeat protein